jgi:hypothetical protein
LRWFDGRKNGKIIDINHNWTFNISISCFDCCQIFFKFSSRGCDKMMGISLPIDLIYILILFLLITIVILGIFVLTSKELIEDIRSGKIWDKVEDFLKKVIGK